MLLKETLTLEKHGCLLQNLVIINFDGPHSILGIEDDGTSPTGLAWGGLPSTNQISRKDLKCAPGDMSRRDTKKIVHMCLKRKSTSKVTTIVVPKYLTFKFHSKITLHSFLRFCSIISCPTNPFPNPSNTKASHHHRAAFPSV